MREATEARAPSAGGAEGEFFGRSLARAAEERVRASARGSLQWGEARLSTLFQPIYCLRRQACLGFEALARAVDGSGAAIGIDRILQATVEGERALLDWTCRALHLRNYAIVDPGDRMLFVNIHPEAAIRDAGRGRDLAELIRYYGLAPKRVCVEILEAGSSDEGLLREAAGAYRDLGASIAMDDFGVGASNEARLALLRPDVVKIDRTILTATLGRDAAARALPAMIERLHMARARVVVEGIETRAEALAAIGAKADYLQGFLFAVPEASLTEEMNGTAVLDALLHPHARGAERAKGLVG